MAKVKSVKTEWLRGEQARLARHAGITPSYLSELLHRKKRPSVDVAVKLAAACIHMNIPLSLHDWVLSSGSTSPLFTSEA